MGGGYIIKLIFNMDKLKIRESDLEFKQARLKSDYIDQIVIEAIIYKEHIEVIFNVSFYMIKNSKGVEGVSKIRRYGLYQRYSKNFYIKVF